MGSNVKEESRSRRIVFPRRRHPKSMAWQGAGEFLPFDPDGMAQRRWGLTRFRILPLTTMIAPIKSIELIENSKHFLCRGSPGCRQFRSLNIQALREKAPDYQTFACAAYCIATRKIWFRHEQSIAWQLGGRKRVSEEVQTLIFRIVPLENPETSEPTAIILSSLKSSFDARLSRRTPRCLMLDHPFAGRPST
jgi:hypothetical protein